MMMAAWEGLRSMTTVKGAFKCHFLIGFSGVKEAIDYLCKINIENFLNSSVSSHNFLIF